MGHKAICYVASVQSHIINFHLPYLKAFSERGYEVFVVTEPDLERYQEYHKGDYGFIQWVPLRTSKKNLSRIHYQWYKAFKDFMKKHSFERVVFNTPIPSFLGRLALKSFKNTTLVYIAHGYHFYQGASLKNWILYYTAEKIASRWTDILILLNGEDYVLSQKKLVNSRLKKECIHYIRGIGVNLEDFSPAAAEKPPQSLLKTPMNHHKLICVAELTHRKNQVQLIEAMKWIDNSVLFLVGDGPLEDNYRQLVDGKGLKDRVKFLGFRRDIPQLLHEADLAVITSRHEGLPRFVMEAMAMGLPVVCTDVRGNRDLVKDGVNGLLVPLHHPRRTAQAIEGLLANPRLFRQMAQKNQRDILPYSTAAVVPALMKLLTSNPGGSSESDT
ncbi:MAG: hypothetical protein AVO33_04255 [delta proteobacterium ML8_F1]|nr:MAG: hypothetical protein AVO33_04255 [delta proteobacterium ML8_F1]